MLHADSFYEGNETGDRFIKRTDSQMQSEAILAYFDGRDSFV